MYHILVLHSKLDHFKVWLARTFKSINIFINGLGIVAIIMGFYRTRVSLGQLLLLHAKGWGPTLLSRVLVTGLSSERCSLKSYFLEARSIRTYFLEARSIRTQPHCLSQGTKFKKLFFQFWTFSAHLNLVKMLYVIVIPPRHHF